MRNKQQTTDNNKGCTFSLIIHPNRQKLPVAACATNETPNYIARR